MFMNCNSLPVALMQSLVATVPQLSSGEDDTPSAELGRSLSYLFLFAILNMIVSVPSSVHRFLPALTI